MKEIPVIYPGQTIGILGGGQLGRMLAIEARKMGYDIRTLSPEKNSPAGQIATKEYVANYTDHEALKEFARNVDVITFEFENVPSETARILSEYTPVRPLGNALHIAQNRLREKQFLQSINIPTVPFAFVRNEKELSAALESLGYNSILKTTDSGYDGKGQLKISDQSNVSEALEMLKADECVLEGFAKFYLEMSVVAARGYNGSFVHYGAVENIHRDHILDISIAPAGLSPEISKYAVTLTKMIMDKLEYVGVLCVEFFVMDDGTILVNEFAPRPHNSGHFTIEACYTSQFELQLRAVCGLPLGSTKQVQPAVMVNVMGQMWMNREPDWEAALRIPNVTLHLYGKQEPKDKRKMGHITALASTVEEAFDKAITARSLAFGIDPAITRKEYLQKIFRA